MRPSEAARRTKPEIDEETRASVYGAALRAGAAIAAGEPIRRGNIVKPGDRDFLQVVLTPGARAIAIPVATRRREHRPVVPRRPRRCDPDAEFQGRERADDAPLGQRDGRREPARAGDRRAGRERLASNGFGRTVTLEVTPEQAEKINVATELGKLSLTLRSVSGPDGAADPTAGPGQEPASSRPGRATCRRRWAARCPRRPVTVEQPPVEVIRGSRRRTGEDRMISDARITEASSHTGIANPRKHARNTK